MNNEKLILRPKKAKGEDGYKTFSIRIKDELVEQLDTVSGQTGYSRNELIGILLNYALEHCVIEDSK